MKKESAKHAFVLLTNKHSSAILNLYRELSLETIPWGEVFILYHRTEEAIPLGINNLSHHVFTNTILKDLNCTPISEGLIPGSCHFPLYDFYLKNNAFDYYWFIEDDVRFLGNWNNLFNLHHTPSRIDFLTCHIRFYQDEPLWHWWDSLYHPEKNIAINLRLRSFNPFFKISRQALEFLFGAQKEKWQGHNEVLFPTLLFLEGYNIADFGGNGSFVLPRMKDKTYIDSELNTEGYLSKGSMRYRPLISKSEFIKNRLHHPVKNHDNE